MGKKSGQQKPTETRFRLTYACLVVVDETVSFRSAEKLDRPVSNLVFDSSGHGNGSGPASDDHVRQAKSLGHRRVDQRRNGTASWRSCRHRDKDQLRSRCSLAK